MEEKILKSVLILLISFIISKIVPKFIRLPKGRQTGKSEIILDFFKQVITIIIYFLAFLAIFKMFNIDVTPYLLSSSIIGFAAGFGAQSLIKDIIAGFYLLLEPHFKIGRTIEVNKCKGEIKKITLKNTYLQTKNEDLYIIPNGEIKTVLVKK